MRNPKLTNILLAVLVFSAASSAHATEACFQNVVAFGASVTQATPYVIPGWSTAVGGVETYGKVFGDSRLPKDNGSSLNKYTPRNFGLSPVRYLVKKYAGKSGLKNIKYVGSYITNSEKDLGSSQIQSLLDGERRALFDSATILVGVDAFYWDAIWGNCGYGTDTGAEAVIPRLVDEAKRLGKIVILGTVPLENPANVKIDSNRTGVGGLWYAPNPRCAESINQTLAEYCKPTDNCYIADLHAAVEDLNCGKKLPMRDGTSYGHYEFRPDGVHMSDKGARYISELMMTALEAHPPECKSLVAVAK